MTTELKPQYDSRASFYGKAQVEANYPVIKLISYTTHVATIIHDGTPDGRKEAKIFGLYSATTLRHIKEFLKQHGFKAESKKQIEHDYMGGQ